MEVVFSEVDVVLTDDVELLELDLIDEEVTWIGMEVVLTVVELLVIDVVLGLMEEEVDEDLLVVEVSLTEDEAVVVTGAAVVTANPGRAAPTRARLKNGKSVEYCMIEDLVWMS